jgi:hypothetical protein
VLGSTSMVVAMVGSDVADSLSIQESGRVAGIRSVSSAFHLAMTRGIPPANHQLILELITITHREIDGGRNWERRRAGAAVTKQVAARTSGQGGGGPI